MPRSWAFVLLAVLLMLPLEGCWSRKELNELGIVVGLGIDKDKDGYEVTVQIVNPGQVSTRNGIRPEATPVSTFSETGETVPEAIRRMTTLVSKKLYFSHLRIVIFGEALAREGIAKPLDYISRDRQMRNDFYLVVAKGSKASDILKISSPIDPIPANNLNVKLANSDKLWAATGQITLDRLMMDLQSPGKDPTLTGILIAGNKRGGETPSQRIEPRAALKYSGMAVFRQDRMVGWLDENGTKSLNYLQGRVHQTLATAKCPQGGTLSANIMNVKTRIRVGKSGDEPVINAHLRIEVDLADAECKIDLSKNESLTWIRKQLEKKTLSVLEEGLEQAQHQFHADIYGFGRYVHRQQVGIWRKVDDWDEQFSRMKVRIYPDIHFRRIGTIQQPIEQVRRE